MVDGRGATSQQWTRNRGLNGGVSAASSTFGPVARVTAALAVVTVLLLSSAITGPLHFSGAGFAHSAGVTPRSTTRSESGALNDPTPSIWNWTNLTGDSGVAPPNRSLAQVAYDPALGAVILFGGYDGAAGNLAYNDTWEYSGNVWTQLSPAVQPAPRWGGGLVYDPALRALILFGGRDDSGFFNDTWEYNATGWHDISTVHAPSARYFFAMSYDPALSEVVLFGGATGNVPAGTFNNFVYYADTWTWVDGVWTNITTTAGAPPIAAEHWGGMTYDAADGYLLLVAGTEYSNACERTYPTGGSWMFEDGQWSSLSPSGSSPPPGEGALWFDSGSNLTLYYEGRDSLSATNSTNCSSTAPELWSYSAGTWTQLNSSPAAPEPRILSAVVDDGTDGEQILFGGQAASLSAQYLADTWQLSGPVAGYNVSFSESGLPSGFVWTVTLGTEVASSSTSPIVFLAPNGTFSFSISSSLGFGTASPSVGHVVVSGAGVSEPIMFVVPALYPVTFTEGGLPPGTGWFLNITGVGSYYTNSTSISVSVPNGSYSFTVLGRDGYQPTPASGTVNVTGASVARTIAFSSLTPCAYPVVFLETGLPVGTSWSVGFGKGASGCDNGELSETSSTSTVTFWLYNGTFAFNIGNVSGAGGGYVPSPQSGQVTVAGENVTVPVTFEGGYTVTLSEAGLAPGTNWSATLRGGGNLSLRAFSQGSSLNFTDILDGTYTFTLSALGYTMAPGSGTLTVSGAPVDQSVSFTPDPGSYVVQFTEAGLRPTGASWTVDLHSNLTVNSSGAEQSTGPTISFRVTNGTYDYAVSVDSESIPNLNPSPASGNVSVSGADVEVAIAIRPSYFVTFTESGLAGSDCPSSEWWVTLNGSTETSYGSSLVFYDQANGSYEFNTSATGCSATPSQGVVNVTGEDPVLAIVFGAPSNTQPVTFTESGLPSGSDWYLYLREGRSYSTTTNSIVFDEPNGTYVYSVESVDPDWAAARPATFSVDGGPVDVTVSFHLVNTVTVDETGLPVGTVWWLNLTGLGSSNGSLPSYSSGGSGPSNIVIDIPNGTYLWTATAPGYTATPSSGTLSLTGAPVNLTVAFALPQGDYSVTFTEDGLAAGTSWSVLLHGVSASGAGSLGFLEPNGTYSFYVPDVLVGGNGTGPTYVPVPTVGNLTVDGTGVTVLIRFVLEYAVNFDETGLANGTNWSVTLNGTTGYNSAPLPIPLPWEPNGTYAFTVSAAGYGATPSSGTVTVSGASVTEEITFTAQPYRVTFTETGLPPGTAWWVNVTGGASTFSTSASLSFNSSNGTFTYTAATSDKEYSSSGGSFLVAGAGVSETASFVAVTYPVTFTETGLPTGTSWTITVGGREATSTGSSVVIAEPNGTYAFTVGGIIGYPGTPSSGSITVAGAAAVQAVAFTAVGYLEITVSPANADVTLDGRAIVGSAGAYSATLAPGAYYVNATLTGFTTYSNLVVVTVGATAAVPIVLLAFPSYGYLSGTVVPTNATVVASGVVVPVADGQFNITLAPGTYYLSVTASGYESKVLETNITAGEVTRVLLSLTAVSSTVTFSGVVSPANASVVLNGFVAYVSGAGAFSVSVAPGTYTLSVVAAGYFPFSETLSILSDSTLDVTLKQEPTSTSTTISGNVSATGYNLTVTALTEGNGSISVTFASTANGTLVVTIPYVDVANATLAQILASRVYVNGVRYENFSVTVTSNYTVELVVRGLSSDPTMFWALSPFANPPSISPPSRAGRSGLLPSTLSAVEGFAVGAVASAVLIFAAVARRARDRRNAEQLVQDVRSFEPRGPD